MVLVFACRDTVLAQNIANTNGMFILDLSKVNFTEDNNLLFPT